MLTELSFRPMTSDCEQQVINEFPQSWKSVYLDKDKYKLNKTNIQPIFFNVSCSNEVRLLQFTQKVMGSNEQ